MKSVSRNNNPAKPVILLLIFISLVFAAVFSSGCSGGESTVYVTKTPGFEEDLTLVLERYFSDELIARLKAETAPIREKFEGVNIFTTAQYGRRFITGTVDIKDVFDARIPHNREIFRKWAKENLLILNPPETQAYYQYALAATEFLKEFEYDAVLFYPDEFHPVLTKKTDTWLFLREEPAVEGQPFYYSGRIDRRQIAVTGGMLMEPVDSTELWLFYIPVAGGTYESYETQSGPVVEGSTRPDLLNPYSPKDATQKIIDARKNLGIIPSNLSGIKGLKVGGWKNENYAEDIRDIGFSFSGARDRYTWGGCGHYLIAIDPRFK